MLQDLDKATSQKKLAEKYSIPQIAISTWKKSSAKVLAGYEKGLDSKRIKPKMYEKIIKTQTLQWWIHWLWSWIIDQAKYPDRLVYHSGSSRKFCWYYLRWRRHESEGSRVYKKAINRRSKNRYRNVREM